MPIFQTRSATGLGAVARPIPEIGMPLAKPVAQARLLGSNSPTPQHTPALGELDLGQRLLVDFWVNPWQNHALGKVSRFQLSNSATPQHPPRTWGVAELELKGAARLQVPKCAIPRLRSTPPRTWGVGFGAASVANFGEDGGHYRNRS